MIRHPAIYVSHYYPDHWAVVREKYASLAAGQEIHCWLVRADLAGAAVAAQIRAGSLTLGVLPSGYADQLHSRVNAAITAAANRRWLRDSFAQGSATQEAQP